MANKTMCVGEAGKNILTLEPGITFKQAVKVIASREHAQDMLNRQKTTVNDGLTAENLRGRPQFD